MTARPQREFVDANILVYALDSSAARKQQTAQQLLERLWDSGTGCVSIQVLQEFFVSITKRVPNPLPVDDAKARIREFAAWTVFAPKADDLVAAIDLHTQASGYLFHSGDPNRLWRRRRARAPGWTNRR